MGSLMAMTGGPLVVGAGSTANILIWVGMLMGAILFGGVLALWLRRRYHDSGGLDGSMETLSLQQLRDLRAAGELSEGEFEALKAAAVQAHGGSAGAGKREPGAVARPGFDLTGEPLPGSGGSDENQNGRETPRADGA